MAIVHVVAKSQIGLEQLTLMSPVISGEGYDAWLKLSTCLFVKQKKKLPVSPPWIEDGMWDLKIYSDGLYSQHVYEFRYTAQGN